MKQSILDIVIENRNGNYCHALEVSEVYELESIAESIYDEFESTHTKQDVIAFLSSASVYVLDETNEGEIYNFSFNDYIEENF